MRGFISYLTASVFVVLVLGILAPMTGFGYSPVGASPAVFGRDSGLQSVDRTNKSDRIPVMKVGKRQTRTPTPPMMAGCDPAFSPLAASARANFARSCIG